MKGKQSAWLGGGILFALICISYVFVWRACIGLTEGRFIYGLDDPYIHLSIGKNIALHGVWGVTQYAFSSASSSPLWSILLATVIRIAGNSDLWPLALGIAASVGATLYLYWRFLRAGFGVPLATVASAGIFAVAPLHMLPFTGMEHCLQILLDLLYAFWLLDTIGRKAERKDLIVGSGLSTVMCLCRYESVFLVMVPVAICLWRRDWRLAAAIGLGPIAAVGGFALYSHFVGMPAVPNSIVLKGNLPKTSTQSYLMALSMRMFSYLRSMSLTMWDMFLIAVAGAITLRLKTVRQSTSSLQVLVWTVLFACMVHSAFATVGIFYRYEAYLLVLLGVVIVLEAKEIWTAAWPKASRAVSKRDWVIASGAVVLGQWVLSNLFWYYQLGFNMPICLIGVGLAVLFSMDAGPKTRGRLGKVIAGAVLGVGVFIVVRDRASTAYTDIANASKDIYLQQYQMSRFVDRYYHRGRLGANDIGAVTYFSEVHLIDLVGLASDGVRKLKTSHNFSTATLKKEIDAFHPDLVIAYPDWFSGKEALPSTLIPVAKWIIPPVTSAACPMVMFYAPDPSRISLLQQQLKEFQPLLPSRVKVEYVGR